MKNRFKMKKRKFDEVNEEFSLADNFINKSLRVRLGEFKKILHSSFFILHLCLFFIFTGCKQAQGPTPEQLAALAAKGYYQHLQQGDIEHYLEGTLGYDSMPEGFKNEQRANIKMFLAQQKEAHGGIASVDVSNATADTIQKIVYALLNIQFADSTKEEICVPMVSRDGKWIMK